MPTPSENQLPDPHPDFASRNNIESPGKNSFRSKALLWQFKNTTMEEACATCSRYALRLIDKVTGRAYTADELIGETNPLTTEDAKELIAPIEFTASLLQATLQVTGVTPAPPSTTFAFHSIANGKPKWQSDTDYPYASLSWSPDDGGIWTYLHKTDAGTTVAIFTKESAADTPIGLTGWTNETAGGAASGSPAVALAGLLVVGNDYPIFKGPYANDGLAAQGGVPKDGAYRKSDGTLVWRVLPGPYDGSEYATIDGVAPGGSYIAADFTIQITDP